MANTLLSGPAGSGKTQEARLLLQTAAAPMVVADFQSILATLILLERNPDGRYPERNPAQAAWLVPLTEAVRQTVVTFAEERDIDLVLTNSDGAAGRRTYLLSRLGPGAAERVIDPGLHVVRARLAGPTGATSQQCEEAIQRWYGRL